MRRSTREGGLPGDVARVVRGREALADFAAHFSRPPEGWHKHLVIEPLIEVEGDTGERHLVLRGAA